MNLYRTSKSQYERLKPEPEEIKYIMIDKDKAEPTEAEVEGQCTGADLANTVQTATDVAKVTLSEGGVDSFHKKCH